MSRHVYECFVRFSDVDVYGHVNNVKYLEFYQEARLAFVMSMTDQSPQGARALVLASIHVDYKRPILFRTLPYSIETWPSRVGRSSFTLESEIKDGDRVLSRAQAVLVTFDATEQRSRAMTDAERAGLVALTTST